MTPRVTVIMPARNVEAFIPEAVLSVMTQSFSAWELLVVDDGSFDGTVRVLERVTDPRVRVLRASGAGIAGALNLALARAAAPVLAFLDADDRWMPDYLARMVTTLDRRPDIDLAFAAARWIDAAGVPQGRSVVRWRGALSYGDLFDEYRMVTRSAFVVRTDPARRLGGFDRALETGSDHDFCLRIARGRPGRCWGVPEVLLQYRRRPGQVTHDVRGRERAWRCLVDKHRAIDPAMVRAREPGATARFLRAMAATAYDSGEWSSARRLFVAGVRRAPVTLVREPRTWIAGGAMLASLLPASLRGPIDRMARRLIDRCSAAA